MKTRFNSLSPEDKRSTGISCWRSLRAARVHGSWQPALQRAAVWLAACGLLALSVRAQESAPISVQSHIDKNEITIGDRINYTVEITRQPEVQVLLPGKAASLGPQIEILEFGDTSFVAQESIVEQSFFVISTFDTGRFVISPLMIQYSSPVDSSWNFLQTEELEFYVKSILPSEAGDIRDIKGPLEVPKDWTRVILYSAIGAGVLLLALLGFYLYRRRRGKGLLPVKSEPPRPAHEVALAELRQLRNSDLLKNGEVKLFYIILSDIIRRYIEGRYQIQALEKTTAELLSELPRVSRNGKASEMVAELLEQSDLVKFAKYIPAAEAPSDHVELAQQYVELTKEVPQPVESPEHAPQESTVTPPQEKQQKEATIEAS